MTPIQIAEARERHSILLTCECGHALRVNARVVPERLICPRCQRRLNQLVARVKQHWAAHAALVFGMIATGVERALGLERRLTEREFHTVVTAFRGWSKARLTTAASLAEFRARYEAADPVLFDEFVRLFARVTPLTPTIAAEREAAWQARLLTARSADPAFDATVAPVFDSLMWLRPVAQRFIKASPLGTDLLRYLAAHPYKSNVAAAEWHPNQLWQRLRDMERRVT